MLFRTEGQDDGYGGSKEGQDKLTGHGVHILHVIRHFQFHLFHVFGVYRGGKDKDFSHLYIFFRQKSAILTPLNACCLLLTLHYASSPAYLAII